jgi:ferrous iron transport protein B
VERHPAASRLTEALDRFVLHPAFGTVLFGLVMLTFFQLIFAWATPAMDAIDALIASPAWAPC